MKSELALATHFKISSSAGTRAHCTYCGRDAWKSSVGKASGLIETSKKDATRALACTANGGLTTEKGSNKKRQNGRTRLTKYKLRALRKRKKFTDYPTSTCEQAISV
uniref:Uncharacterized protein n=1 Tax=Dunaliella tertiolecta TaxID=3047 RepID=A0A6S8M1J7_DUNTE|eukprot:1158502-Pelagomonas_calceolata.AAC.3